MNEIQNEAREQQLTPADSLRKASEVDRVVPWSATELVAKIRARVIAEEIEAREEMSKHASKTVLHFGAWCEMKLCLRMLRWLDDISAVDPVAGVEHGRETP